MTKGAVITGASGVVGSALAAELAGRGIPVLLLLRKGSENNGRLLSSLAGIPGASELVIARECSLPELSGFVNDTGVEYDAFFHLGWTGTKGKSRFDLRIHNRNVEYALDAVELAAALNCSVFIGAGSQAEYGRKNEPLTPGTAAFPENAYGIGKLAAGFATRLRARELGLRHIWTRILSVYGPNDGEKTLVTSLVRSLLCGERPVTTAGEQIWDYIYSGDTARALAAAWERGVDGKTYLIASGKERPLKDYILDIRDVVSPGAGIGIGEVPYGENQVMYLAADISETVRDLLWEPEVEFRDGIRKMADAERQQMRVNDSRLI